MWKKLLCVGATEDAPPPPSAGSASPPASAPTPKPSLPQLQLSQPLEAASITHPEQFTPSATAGTPPKITPTARPPPDSTAASSNRPSLPPLHYSPPIASVNLTPPTPIDAPSHPLLPRVPSSTTHLPPPPRQNPHSTHPSTASHRRSGSGSGSQSRSYKETLNAYAVDSGTGTRTVNQYRLGGNGTGDDGHLGKGSYATVERATDSETGVEYVSRQLMGVERAGGAVTSAETGADSFSFTLLPPPGLPSRSTNHHPVQHSTHTQAIKEFSKRRLRQIAATEAARRARAAGGGARGRGRGRSRGGFSSISSREPPVEVDVDSQGPDNLDLIRTEVAIMKKVDHPNIASVHEVIDVTRWVVICLFFDPVRC